MEANNSDIYKNIIIAGAVLILIGIALGAIGAHGLEDKLTPKQLNSFEVGVRYQIYHGLALLIIGFNITKLSFSPIWFYRLILTGVILFSGSIFIFSCKDIIHLSIPKPLYLITPLGGVTMIAGWSNLILNLIRK